MISLNYKYRNKHNAPDVVRPSSIEYIDGLKCVIFHRDTRVREFSLPIEMFEKNFEKVEIGHEQ